MRKQQRLRKKLISNGCCPRCSNPTEGYFYCSKCRNKRALEKRLQRLQLKGITPVNAILTIKKVYYG